MKIVNFIGNYSKTELILYVSKIVQSIENSKILIIDSYTTQKCRCTIPTIFNDDQYITSFEEIDIAIGFKSHKDIVKYLDDHGEEFNAYDYVFIDIDSQAMCKDFNVENANITFCITSYDKYDILKTVGLIDEIVNHKKDYIESITMNRVYIFSLLNTSDQRYIDHSFNEIGLKWKETSIYVPLDEGDASVIIQNQYAEKMKFKELSQLYKKALVGIAQVIVPNRNIMEITKVLKNIERRV